MSGQKLIERLKRERPDMRVILMSGYTDDGLKQRELDADVAFLEKPFTPATLMLKVREVLSAGAGSQGDAGVHPEKGS